MTSANGSVQSPAAGSQDNVLIVGAGFTVEGHVRGQGTLLVSGSIKGNVTADSVKLAETGHVSGHVECSQLDVAGRLEGSFQVGDVVVRAGGAVATAAGAVSTGTCVVAGVVQGSLKANLLKVEASGQLSGQTVASQLDVFGQVHGEVDVGDMVVRNRAVVDAKVAYGNLSMERGSDVTGPIQRKQRQAAAPAATPVPARPGADESLFIHLPQNIGEQLRVQGREATISLANGDALPAWVSLDRDNARLVLRKAEFDRLVARGDSVTVRLQAGTENLVFKLPPDAQ